MTTDWRLFSLLNESYGVGEESLRFMTSILMSYLFCLAFNVKSVSQSATLKQLYSIVVGIALMYFNFGTDVCHSLITCLFCYATIKLFDSISALIINFTFTLTYLLIGCRLTQIGSKYSICWTLPQCVLTLRLIAITFDFHDERKISVN